jgi:MFS family permease
VPERGRSVEQRLDPTIWRNRPFVMLWAAQAISQTAQNAIWYGMMVLVQNSSGSSTQMSLAIMTLVVPSVLFGIVAGAYVDRWDKRLVLIGTNALRAVITLGYIAFAPGPGGEGVHRLAFIYVVNFIFSTVGQFFGPAEAAMIPTIVPRQRLMQANSMFHLTFTASQLIGLVLLGPVVVTVWGVNGLFVVVSGAIGVCALLCWPLPAGTGETPAEEQARSLPALIDDIHEVWSFMRRDRVVRLAIYHWTLGATLAIVVAMLGPNFAVHVVGVRAENSVFVLAPAGVGMLLGTIVLGRRGEHLDKRRLIELGLLGVGTALLLLGLLRPIFTFLARASGWFVVPPDGTNAGLIGTTMVLTLAAGGAFVAIIVASQTIIQERVPVAVRGRVFAVQLVLSNAASVAPLLFLGGLADLIGVGPTLALLGACVLAINVITTRMHRSWERSERGTLDGPPKVDGQGLTTKGY